MINMRFKYDDLESLNRNQLNICETIRISIASLYRYLRM